jgi:hypothetical protein
MKALVIAAALSFSGYAVAGDGLHLTPNLSSSSNQSATTQSAATNNGNAQSITFTSPDVTHSYSQVGGTETIKNVPNPSAPALTTSNDTCMGSTSGSVTIAGLGVGGGSTWVDKNCKILKNSRELWNMGLKAAAIALLCQDDDNRKALEITGYACPAEKSDKK